MFSKLRKALRFHRKWTFILKSGSAFSFYAKDVTLYYNSTTGHATRYEIEGLLRKRPVFIDINQIEAVVRS